MVLLEPDAFLTQLTRALEKARASGTVYVTFKRGAQRTTRPLAPRQVLSMRCSRCAAQ